MEQLNLYAGNFFDRIETSEISDSSVPCWNNLIRYVNANRFKPMLEVAGIINAICPCLTPEIFMVKKQYTVVKSVERSEGKWSQSLGNSFFIDSQYMLPDLVEMFEDHFAWFLNERQIEKTKHLQVY